MSNTIETNALEQYYLGQADAGSGRGELGANEFMTLLLEQLKNQDPLQPKESGEFIAQMAQFSTVAGIDEMNDAFGNVATQLNNNRALQAASLVGRSVLVADDGFSMSQDNDVEGAYTLDVNGSVTASIYDVSGELIHELDLGLQSAGEHEFAWDGLLENGERVADGQYTITITQGTGEGSVLAPLGILQEIESVNFNTSDGEIVLNMAEGLSLNFSEVSQIH